ncbi:MAG: alpha/beta hydrolase [Dongiaceae bacterium]
MPDVIMIGPAGRLEGRYLPAKKPNAPIALVLHPHPLYGGTMNNKVVYTLFHTFAQQGFSALRFNFRGVGRSEGKFDRGEGELSDAASALDWLQTHNPDAPYCWIAGFSFGAWIGMQLLMRRPEITAFISVAPPANSTFSFDFLAPCPASGLILRGDKDEVAAQEGVDKLVNKLKSQRGIAIDYRTIRGADHFFTDHLERVGREVKEYLVNFDPEAQPAPPEREKEKAKAR